MTALNGTNTSVELVDGAHEVMFTTNSLIEVERRFGTFAALDAAIETSPIETTRHLIWVGIGKTAGDKEVTEEEAGDLIPAPRLTELLTTVTRAIREAMGVASSVDEEEADPTTPAKAGSTSRTRSTRSSPTP